MVNFDRTSLSGLIEADETYIGDPAKGKKGRGVRVSKNKLLFGSAVEILNYKAKNGELGKKAGRLRLQILKSASENEIENFLKTNVAHGSTIKSDGWSGYSKFAFVGFSHQKEIQGGFQKEPEIASQINQIFSNLKSWIIGIHHGVEPKYLQFYLDEYVFRFNRKAYPMSSFRSLFKILLSKKTINIGKTQDTLVKWESI